MTDRLAIGHWPLVIGYWLLVNLCCPFGTVSAGIASQLGSPPVCAIHWLPDPADKHKFVVQVSGLDAVTIEELRRADWSPGQWQQLLSVHAEAGDSTADMAVPAMLGAYRIDGGVLRFEPQFPLEPGVRYRAAFDPNRLPSATRAGPMLLTAVFQLPTRVSKPSTVVAQIYPTAGLLPENLLKFYLHFSAAMSRGHIYDFIHLRDEQGKDVELPFLEIDEELWDPAMTRLTLFIDPGRIKRGVRPLEEVGPALQEGKRYRLVIDRAWKDGSGNPLKESFQKSFKVGPPDRQPPDPGHWKIRAPKSGTRDAITVTFPKPLDHALAQRLIQVTTESGELVQGQTALHDEERQWTLVPLAPWHRGPHRLIIATTIEDLAGNNVGKPFEVDLFDEIPGHLTSPSVKLPFEIR